MTGLQSRFGKVTTALVAAGIVAVTLTGCGDNKKQATADGFTVVKVGVVGDYNAQWEIPSTTFSRKTRFRSNS